MELDHRYSYRLTVLSPISALIEQLTGRYLPDDVGREAFELKKGSTLENLVETLVGCIEAHLSPRIDTSIPLANIGKPGWPTEEEIDEYARKFSAEVWRAAEAEWKKRHPHGPALAERGQSYVRGRDFQTNEELVEAVRARESHAPVKDSRGEVVVALPNPGSIN